MTSSFSPSTRTLVRFGVAFLLAFVCLAFLIEIVDSGAISTYKLRVNALSRPGKADTTVDSQTGHLKLNILNNSFFSNRDPSEKTLLILGASVVTLMPQVRFTYQGEKYRTYNFGITGNPIVATTKIFSIMSALKPDAIILGLGPTQTEEQPTFFYDPFGLECLGALRAYHFMGNEFSDEDTCDLLQPRRRPFSLKMVGSNMQHMALRSVYLEKDRKLDANNRNDEEIQFSRRLSFFRAVLAGVGMDWHRSASALVVGHPIHSRLKLGEAVDLGDMSGPQLNQAQNKLESKIANFPDSPNPKPHHGNDASEQWATRHNLKALREGSTFIRIYEGMADLAAQRNVKLAIYNSPLAHTTPGLFPENYYTDYRNGLADFSHRKGVLYIDEGDFLLNKGTLWQDTFHLGIEGSRILAQGLVYDLIKSGLLNKPQP